MTFIPTCPFKPWDENTSQKNDTATIYFMKCAYNEALKAWENGDIPIGAVAVTQNTIVARSYNKVEQQQCACAHAEINIIQQLSQQIGSWRLDNYTLYVTKEPCPMCSGAIYKARIPQVVIGLKDEEQGCLGGKFFLHEHLRLYHTVSIQYETLQGACKDLLLEFFKQRRQAAKQARSA